MPGISGKPPGHMIVGNDPDLPVKRRARSLARVLGDLVQPRETETVELK